MPPSATAVAELQAGCLARQGVFCRSCGEHCEAEAIQFRPAVGRAPLPRIDPGTCTGCGDCVQVCPARAILLIRREAEAVGS